MYTLNFYPTFPDFSQALLLNSIGYETLSAHWFNYPLTARYALENFALKVVTWPTKITIRSLHG